MLISGNSIVTTPEFSFKVYAPFVRWIPQFRTPMEQFLWIDPEPPVQKFPIPYVMKQKKYPFKMTLDCNILPKNVCKL